MRLNLDRIARTHIHLAGRPLGAFYVCGWSGFWLALVLVLGLSSARGLSMPLQAAIALTAVGVYVGMTTVARHALARPAIIYYHHILAFLACTAALTSVLGGPVLAHLDVTACGLGAFTAVARVGCLMVGCCHGRPARWGIAYGPEQVPHGIPAYLVRLPLLPVQGMEAAASAALTVAGSAALLADAPAGTAFVIFVAGYATVRFGLEWLRGDLVRHHAHRLSEAQWTSLALTVGVAAGAASGVLPGGLWPAAAAASVLVATGATVIGRFPGRTELLAPTHVSEIAARLERLPPSRPDSVATARTSRGLRVSLGQTDEFVHYTLSTDEPLGDEEGERLARLLMWMRHPDMQARVIAGPAGAVHVVAQRAAD